MRRHHAAFTRRDLLVRIKREDRTRAMRAKPRTLVLRAERLARVLDQSQTVPLRDRPELVELARVAVDVDRHDRLRPRRYCRLDRPRIHVQRARVDVGEYRNATLVDEAVRTRGERVRRRDHFVTRRDARGDAEQVQPRRPGGHGSRVRCADPFGKELFEAVDGRTERQAARPQYFEHERLVALVHVRPRERDGPRLLFHACVFAAGAYSSHWPHRSVRPCTVSRYAAWISTVTGPGGPIG